MTREEWLELASTLIGERIFRPKGYKIPKIRVSIGFTGARDAKKTLGACWSPSASDDGLAQIFITPTQSNSEDVMAVLVHELCHAVVGNDKGHGKVFRTCAIAVGLEGKMRSTVASTALKKSLNEITLEIGELPHAKLNMNLNPKKKQGTRLLKVFCPESEYTARITKKWIDEFGPPTCPCCHSIMLVDLPET